MLKTAIKSVLLAICIVSSARIAAAPADEVRALVEAGKAAEAYDLGAKES